MARTKRCLAYRGKSRGDSGTDSAFASSQVGESISPACINLSSNLSLLIFNAWRFFARWINDGEFGSTASIAASAQERSREPLPKYRQQAASSPTTFPPKGACEAYLASI